MKAGLAFFNAGDEKGSSLVEILIGMTIFAVALLGLSHSMFGVMNADITSKNTIKATNLAHQRLEHVMSSLRYDSINMTNYSNEEYGQISGGAREYQKFKRSVTITDSTNALGFSVLKEITVKVEWVEQCGTRNVELNSSISRFKDIRL